MSLRINPCLSSQHLNLHANLSKSLEDPVSRELMLKAVTLNPCGHDLNEDTAIQCLAYNNLCPLDRRPIEKYTPNYTDTLPRLSHQLLLNQRLLIKKLRNISPKEKNSPNKEIMKAPSKNLSKPWKSVLPTKKPKIILNLA